MLSSKQSLERHSTHCKGISHKFECQVCHKVFANRCSKCAHQKACKANGIIKEQEHGTTAVNVGEGVGTDVHNTNNNVTYNNGQVADTINNTTNVIVFPLNDAHIPFLLDHITPKDIAKMFYRAASPISGLQQYGEMILNRPENLCVKKTNPRSAYCSIHKGENKWKLASDKDVIPKLTNHIAEMCLETFENYLNQIRLPTYVKETAMDAFNDIVSDRNPIYNQAIASIKAAIMNASDVDPKRV